MAGTLFDELGGMPTIEKVHVIFYDKLLSHPWLKDFFKGVPRPHLETQQTNFMAGLFGGPRIYGGRPLKTGHMHMFITEEVFLIRHQLLEQSLTEAKIPPELKKRWLSYDMGTKTQLVKESASECAGRYKSEAIIVVEKPR
jgi:truncated hemoglobin YjbI